MVKSFIEQLGVPRAEKEYLHFARIDKVETFVIWKESFFWSIPIYCPD